MLEKFDKKQLLERVSSGVLLSILAVVSVFYSPLFGLVCVAVAGVALYEWFSIVSVKPASKSKQALAAHEKKVRVFTGVSLVAIFFPMLLSTHMSVFVGMLGLGFLSVTFFLFLNLINTPRKAFIKALGVVYIGIPFNALVWLRSDPESGLLLILYVMFVTWGSDTIAYFTGKSVGGKKLAPSISPNKTWAGFTGACAGAVVGGLIVYIIHVLTLDKEQLVDVTYFSIFSVGFWFVTIFSALLGAVGQGGDLLESVLKRHYNIKDSGKLIPGHGGILDRIDALLVVASLVAIAHFATQYLFRISVASGMM